MDYKNLNIEELLKKSKEFDKISKELDRLKKRQKEEELELKKEREEFKLFCEKNNLTYTVLYNFSPPAEVLKNLIDCKHQGVMLAQERERYNQQFKQVMQNFEHSMEKREKELVEAWEKFRAISTKKYRKTLEEINNENL
jgi:chromosome segregation and condensation protein ScpB